MRKILFEGPYPNDKIQCEYFDGEDWHPYPDVEDIAEAYLEAFRELGIVVGIEAPSGPMFFATCNPGWNGRISSEAIEVHNILLELAEDEGWDIEEMATARNNTGGK